MRRQLRYAQQTRDEVIERQLQRLGFNADDVKYVVYSHFHLDPAGNVRLFPEGQACGAERRAEERLVAGEVPPRATPRGTRR